MALFKIMNTTRRNMPNLSQVHAHGTSIINLLEKEALYRKLSFYIFDLFLNKESSSFIYIAYYAHFDADYRQVIKIFANKSKKKKLSMIIIKFDFIVIVMYTNIICMFGEQWGNSFAFIMFTVRIVLWRAINII